MIRRVFSLEPEIERLRPHLGASLTDALIAKDRREVFSIYPELRIASWAGALLIATAVGILIKENFDLFERGFLAGAIGVAAALCYAWAFRHRRRSSIADDYVLLLGALLLSAGVGFIEQQWHVLGDDWQRQFLLLAVVHAVTAYAFDSRLVLSLSITSLATWLGIEQTDIEVMSMADFAIRAWTCSAVLLVWRAVNRRPAFSRVFEHFAATLALWGSLVLVYDRETLRSGCLLTIFMATAVIRWGFRAHVQSFVLYGYAAAVIAAITLALDFMEHDDALFALVIVLGMIAAVSGLIVLHRRFRGGRE